MKAISSKSLSDAAKEYFKSPLKHAAVSRHQSLYHYQCSDLIRLKKRVGRDPGNFRQKSN